MKKHEILVGVMTSRRKGKLDLLSHFRPGDSNTDPAEESTTVGDLLDEGWTLQSVAPAGPRSKPLMFWQREFSVPSGGIGDAWG